MKRIVFDSEGDGLIHDATVIWCICAEDIDTGEKRSITWSKDKPITKEDIEDLLGGATELICHNAIGHDLPLFKKLTGWEPSEFCRITDTLVLSYLANPDRKTPTGYQGSGGPHSLEAYGFRVGRWKPEHNDWSKFTPAMLFRCEEDRAINVLAYHLLKAECSKIPEEAMQLEHDIYAIISKQERTGIPFDSERARRYVADLSEEIRKIDEEVVPRLPKTLVKIGSVPVNNPFLKTGGYRKQTADYIAEAWPDRVGQSIVGGPFNRIKFEDFDLGSVEKVKTYLLENGWIPDNWNYSKKTGERTSPKLDGEFRGVDGELPGLVRKRITLRHRRSQIEGWLLRVRPDGRLSAGAITNGTNTNRMKHFTVVNMTKANRDKDTGELIWDTELQSDFFGTQMRSLFCTVEGYDLVGHDAKGLELRMLAHYMEDEEYIRQILEGDIHEYNQIKAGLLDRDQAKTFIYAFLYGAGDEKLGRVVGGGAKEGAELRRAFLSSLPNLKRLLDRVKRASGKGYLKGLDGRQVIMRRDEDGRVLQHKALNTLLQHSGSIVMKWSCVDLWSNVREHGLDAHKVLDMHDEGQALVYQPHTELYEPLAVQSIVSAGGHFNLRIPLDADVKIGINLAETH